MNCPIKTPNLCSTVINNIPSSLFTTSCLKNFCVFQEERGTKGTTQATRLSYGTANARLGLINNLLEVGRFTGTLITYKK